MPSVPRYNQQIQEQGFQPPRIGAEAPVVPEASLGANQAVPRAAAELNNTAREIYLAEKKKADDIKQTANEEELAALETQLLHSQDEGVLNMKGDEAKMAPDQAWERFQRATQEIAKRQNNEVQMTEFKRRADATWLGMNRQIQAHVSRETERAAYDTTQRANDNEINLGITNYADPVRVEQAKRNIGAQLDRLRIAVHMPDEQFQQAQTDAYTKLNVGIIQRMVNNGMVNGARKYYQRTLQEESRAQGRGWKGEFIEGSQRGRIEEMLNEAGVGQKSLEMSNQILQMFPETGPEGLASARQWLMRNVSDEKLFDAVDRRLQREYGLRDQWKRRNDDENYLSVYGTLEKTKELPQPGDPAWMSLTPTQRESLYAVQKRMTSKPVRENDAKVFTKFWGMDWTRLGGYTESELLQQAYPYLTDASYGQLLNKWSAARDAMSGDQGPGSKGAKAQDQWKSMMTDKEMVFRFLQDNKVAGIGPSDTADALHKDKAKAEAFNKFFMATDQAFGSFYNQNGRNPNDSEKQQIIDEMAKRDVWRKKGWFSGSVPMPVASLNEEQKKSGKLYVPIDKIPEGAVMKMLNRARAMGQIKPNVTDAQARVQYQKNLERAYAAAVAGSPDTEVISILIGK